MTGDVAFVLPVARWSPPFWPHEFVLQEPEPLSNLEYAFGRLAGSIDDLGATLQAMQLPNWTGPAADSYRGYLNTLNNTLGTLTLALSSAAAATGLAHDDIEGYRRPMAVDAANICNEAQTAHIQELANQAAIEAAGLPSTYVNHAAVDVLMAEGISRGITCQEGVQQTLGQLATSLLATDESFTSLIIPMPTMSGDAVLAGLFAPVLGSSATTGQTQAAADLVAAVSSSGNMGFGDLRAALQGLTAAEREWVLDHLPTGLITELLLRNTVAELQGDYDWLAANLPLDQLQFIVSADPYNYFRPSGFDGGPQNIFWSGLALGPENPSGAVSELDQGALGDCHLLASLAAIASTEAGKKFFEEYVQQNSNGSYTVTLYGVDGLPFTVVVLPEVATSEDYNGADVPAYARPKESSLNVYQIYEKAVAQAAALGLVDLNSEPGGFGDANGGFPANDMPVITGEDARALPSSTVTFEMIDQYLEDGKLVTVTTLTTGLTLPRSFYDQGKVPAADHVYYVTDIDLKGDPPTVTLRNPWGPDEDLTLTLSLDELQNGTQTVTVGSLQ